MSAAELSARDGESRRARNRQLVLFSVIAAVLLLAFALWLTASGGKAPAPAARIDAELAGPGTAEESWTRRSEARLGVIEARMRDMETESRRLKAENERLQGALRKNAENARAVIDRQAAFIDELKRANEAGTHAAAAGPGGSVPAGADPFTGGRADRPSAGANPGVSVARQAAPLIERFELDGAPFGEPDGVDSKPLSTWLPAGSHAEAVVLAGVDASAGISSQGDPRPVLLRLTGPAWTAAPSASEDAAALSVDLAGCTVTGAAHGDLSSEKVYARLRTLTCAGPEPGTVVETRVAGFVANAGKAGVRGPVVSREGALIEKAFLAGLVSGVGQGVSQAFQPQAAASGAAALANTGLADIGRAGIGAGAASAGQKVADYLIRRAEQYQPVIQLRAGTRVTVVFIEGARLDGRPSVRRENNND